ncbi:hypothetical protein CVT24_008352 [Panaeolus cyanescens]|uniref:non-specific serine/threonine protein kinase n=1 Tax=Panaeolus cyanescens TaxID=181874 RepID=A0A409VE09_9AGAR|nr:hypothetical protein CVT24_008352 [Panaeolus cyanescens]
MLGSHTKQINAYGKRGKRVIDSSSSTTGGKSSLVSELVSIFDDLPPAPAWTSVASKMKKRENTIPTQPTLKLAPKVVGLQKKKRLSPVLSPLKKKQLSRVTQLKMENKSTASSPVLSVKSTTTVSEDPDEVLASPAPLSNGISLHIPASPAVSKLKQRAGTSKGTPLRLKKPFTPFVDVDILVVDDEGKTISKERRVSKTGTKPTARKLEKKPIVISLSTDGESDAPPLRPKRPAARKQAIIISDDSDTEIDEVVARSPSRKEIKKHIASGQQTAKPLAKSGSSIVEVVIPPAPYRIAKPIPAPEFVAKPVETPISPLILETPQDIHFAENHAPLRQADSPILKPRQLTPIRGVRRRLFEPPSPPSPTTPTDFDLSIDFSDLSLGSASASHRASYMNDQETPQYLIPLLEECLQEDCGPHNFSTFIESFPFDPIFMHARGKGSEDLQFRKIGEASYSEVFGIGDVVLKVIPLRDETVSDTIDDGMSYDGPAPSDVKDVRKEIIVTRAMGEVYGRFVKLLKAYVVKGRYPEVLLQLWDEYNERKGSENVRPDTFKVSQLYAIIVLPNGGPDLEAYTFQNAAKQGWRQACSLFWQVTKALAHAEHLVSFEHRDLHVGQILVKDLPIQNASNILKPHSTNQRGRPKAIRVYMDDASHGIEATVIDLGLSRMDAGDGHGGDPIHWTPIDQEVFEGEGDYQFDIYRMMRDMTNSDWQGFHPITNVLWLHYLLLKLLQSKGLKPPSAPRKTKGTSTEPSVVIPDAAFTEKDCYDCLVDLENWLATCIKTVMAGMKPRGKGGRKTHTALKSIPSGVGPVRAGEVVAYGVKKGWIKPTPLR